MALKWSDADTKKQIGKGKKKNERDADVGRKLLKMLKEKRLKMEEDFNDKTGGRKMSR